MRFLGQPPERGVRKSRPARALILCLLVLAASGAHAQDTLRDPFSAAKWEMFKRSSMSGRLVYVRGNVSLRALKDRQRYAYRAGFVIKLKNPNSFGLPTTDEAEELAPIENEIDRGMEKGRLAFMALVITTTGMREYVFYTDQPEAVRKRVAQLKRGIRGREVQTYVTADPGWDIYERFTQ